MTRKLAEARVQLEILGLRPLDYPEVAAILADCPSCNGGTDFYLPLRVFQMFGEGEKSPIRFRCGEGCSEDAIKAALANPIDWQAIALELLVIAQTLRTALDEAQNRPAPRHLKVAA